jgi:CHASE1-domain containing sensor protein
VTDTDAGHARPLSPSAGRASVPLWRSPAAGALLAIALLIAVTVIAAVWLSIVDQQRQAQVQLSRLAHDAALTIRGRLVETEQMLLLEGSVYADAPARFRSDVSELLQASCGCATAIR